MEQLYRYETHLHTKEGSACSQSTAAEMVHAYIRAGYAGMIITDHFFNGNTAVSSSLPWPERVEAFCKGYENALEAAKGKDFQVFFGWEYAYFGTEFLTYGLDKAFLLAHPELLSWSVDTYFDKVHEAGGFISHAHPFRQADYIKTLRLYPTKVDAAEVANLSHSNKNFDAKAKEYALNNGLLMTGGSDTHDAKRLAGGGMTFQRPLHTIEEFIQAVKNGEGTPIQKFN